MLVFSTGRAGPLKDACLDSVRSQDVSVIHLYIDLPSHHDVCKTLYHAMRKLAPEEIVIHLDGDDTLADPGVTRYLAEVYSDPMVWMTYGQFRSPTGEVGFAALYASPHYRYEPWLATHLRTFRAGLFQKIKEEDFKLADGSWPETAVDHAYAFPMLEMGGPEHVRFIDRVLCVYTPRFALAATREEIAKETANAAWFRSKPSYARLTERPWP